MSQTPNILKKIIEKKLENIREKSDQLPLRRLAAGLAGIDPCRGFAVAVESKIAAGEPAIIAEIKRASPSKGVIRDKFNPAKIATSYQKGGATCLSVLTEADFFMGEDEHLREAKAACSLPMLRKDFIVDPYQVYESRSVGADCILLIVACLGDAQLRELNDLAYHLDMDVLIEVHDEDELERALQLNNRLIGINNRNLHSFEVSLDTTLRLLDKVPNDRIVVTESGIHTAEDVELLQQQAVNAFLVGEAFMRADEPGEKLAELFL